MKNRKHDAAAIPGTIALWISAAPLAHAGFVNEAGTTTSASTAAQPLDLTVSANTPATTAAIAISTSAVAGAQQTRPVEHGTQVSQIGFHPDDVELRRGSGRAIDLSDMLKAVVPGGYHVDLGDVEPTLLVSWRGGLPWDDVLVNAIKPLPEVHVTFDWDQKTVSLRKAPDAHPSSTMGAHPMATVAGATDAQVAVTPPIESWTIRQGYPIGQELQTWAKRAGWTVVWGLQRDVVAPSSTTFTGDFASAASDVIRTLAENGALIHAQIFDGNHTLVVQGPGVTPQ